MGLAALKETGCRRCPTGWGLRLPKTDRQGRRRVRAIQARALSANQTRKIPMTGSPAFATCDRVREGPAASERLLPATAATLRRADYYRRLRASTHLSPFQ